MTDAQTPPILRMRALRARAAILKLLTARKVSKNGRGQKMSKALKRNVATRSRASWPCDWATEGGFLDNRVVWGGLGAWVGGVNT